MKETSTRLFSIGKAFGFNQCQNFVPHTSQLFHSRLFLPVRPLHKRTVEHFDCAPARGLRQNI